MTSILFILLLGLQLLTFAWSAQLDCAGSYCCQLIPGGVRCPIATFPAANYTDIVVAVGQVAARLTDGRWRTSDGRFWPPPLCRIAGDLRVTNGTYRQGVLGPGGPSCDGSMIPRVGLACQFISDRLNCSNRLGSGLPAAAAAAVSADGDVCIIGYSGYLSCLSTTVPYPGRVTQVAITTGGGCAIDLAGTTRCWGTVTVPGVGPVLSISPGPGGSVAGRRILGGSYVVDTSGSDLESLIPADAIQVEVVPGSVCWITHVGDIGCGGRLTYNLPGVGATLLRLTATNVHYLDIHRNLIVPGVGSLRGPVDLLDTSASAACVAVNGSMWTVTVGTQGLVLVSGLPGGGAKTPNRYSALSCSGCLAVSTANTFVPGISGTSPPNGTVALASSPVGQQTFTLDWKGVLRLHDWSDIPTVTTVMPGVWRSLRSADRIVAATTMGGAPYLWTYGGLVSPKMPGPPVGGLRTSPCRPGRFARAPGYADDGCAGPCRAGYWGTGPTDQCSGRCPAGTSCPAGTAVPLPCPAGQAGLDCSVACPAGTRCPPGTAVPLPCSPGTAQPLPGQADCPICPPDTVAEPTRCLTCPPGQGPRSGTCQPCPPGQASPAGICQFCPLGTVSAGGALGCQVCPAGHYVENNTCTPCPSGQVSSAGSAACSLCPLGHVTLDHVGCQLCPGGQVPLNDTCQPCPPGSMAPVGSLTCSACPAGTYAPQAGLLACLTCDTVVLDGQHCLLDTCGPGLVLSPNGTCQACPVGTYDGGRTCRACPPNTYTITIGSVACLPCPVGLACVEGRATSLAGRWLVSSNGSARAVPCPPDRCLAGSTCAPLRSGLLCGSCDMGAAEWSGTCRTCDRDVNGGLLVAVLLLGVVGLGALAWSAQRGAGLVGILSYYIQTATVIVGPEEPAVGWLSLLNLQPSVGGPCLALVSSTTGFILELAYPLVLVAGMAIMSGGYLLYHHISKRPLPWDRVTRAFIILGLWAVTPTLRTLLRLAQCVDVGDGSVLYSLPGVACGSSQHGGLLAGALAVLLVVGTLVGLLSRTAAGWACLTEAYSAHCYWWPLVVLARRALTILLAELLFADAAGRYFGLTILGLICYLLHDHARPYQDRSLNRLEGGSLLLLTLLAALLIGYPPPLTVGLRAVVVLLVSGPSLGLLLRLAVVRYAGRNRTRDKVELGSV